MLAVPISLGAGLCGKCMVDMELSRLMELLYTITSLLRGYPLHVRESGISLSQ
jgi:hypothetical protein